MQFYFLTTIKIIEDKMKIDFITKYDEGEYEGLCEKAISLSLDGLVMTELDSNRDRGYKSLKIFPAQEVEWKAALENYKGIQDYLKNRTNFITQVYKGKALVLLPSEKSFLENYDNELYELLREVSEIGGLVVSLHDDENIGVPMNFHEREYLYPFDAIRIRAYNQKDVNSMVQFGPVYVSGSSSSSSSDLENNCVFTNINERINSKNELISKIKAKVKTELYVLDKHNNLINFRDTVKPYEINKEGIREFVDKIFSHK